MRNTMTGKILKLIAIAALLLALLVTGAAAEDGYTVSVSFWDLTEETAIRSGDANYVAV